MHSIRHNIPPKHFMKQSTSTLYTPSSQNHEHRETNEFAYTRIIGKPEIPAVVQNPWTLGKDDERDASRQGLKGLRRDSVLARSRAGVYMYESYTHGQRDSGHSRDAVSHCYELSRRRAV